jgi:hypothetical protein
MHLVGYLYEDCHDAQSLEHKVQTLCLKQSDIFHLSRYKGIFALMVWDVTNYFKLYDREHITMMILAASL